MPYKSKVTQRDYDHARYVRIHQERLAMRPPDPIAAISDRDLAYLAGLVDGDGSVYAVVGAHRPSCWPGDTWQIHYPAMTVAMTHRPVIEWLAQLWQTSIFLHNQSNLRRYPHLKPQWRTQLQGRRATMMCQRLLPYLKVRHEQARLVGMWPPDARQRPGQTMCWQDWLERAVLAEELSSLNG